MKTFLPVLFLVLAGLAAAMPTEARASGSATFTGRWAGTAFAAPFDLDGDGLPARTFAFTVYSSLAFRSIEGVADASLVALPGQGACSDPGAFELAPSGRAMFRGPLGDALYVTIDPAHLCFNPASPSEVMHLTVAGGTGAYAGKTGNGTANLHDAVLLTAPSGALLMIDSKGEFSLSVQ